MLNSYYHCALDFEVSPAFESCASSQADQGTRAHMYRVSAEQPLTTVLHVLVNNSGATWGEALGNYPDAAFTKLLTLNVQRVFTLTQKLVPLLRKGSKQDGVGRVINVSAHSGFSPQVSAAHLRSDPSTESTPPDSRRTLTLLRKQLCTSSPSTLQDNLAQTSPSTLSLLVPSAPR